MPEGLGDAVNESVWEYMVTKSKVTRYGIHDAGAKSKGLGFIFPTVVYRLVHMMWFLLYPATAL